MDVKTHTYMYTTEFYHNGESIGFAACVVGAFVGMGIIRNGKGYKVESISIDLDSNTILCICSIISDLF